MLLNSVIVSVSYIVKQLHNSDDVADHFSSSQSHAYDEILLLTLLHFLIEFLLSTSLFMIFTGRMYDEIFTP